MEKIETKTRRSQLMNGPLYHPDVLQFDSQGGRFGPIEGVKVGDKWDSRKALFNAGVHRELSAGIAGSVERGGAYSVVLSGSYEDDVDAGDVFIYTGAGGRGPDSSRGGNMPQIEHQSFLHIDNQTLVKSLETRRPVRVIRGPNKDSAFSPASGYRYDGLYEVKSAYMDKGKSGFQVCKYRLRRLPNQAPLPTN